MLVSAPQLRRTPIDRVRWDSPGAGGQTEPRDTRPPRPAPLVEVTEDRPLVPADDSLRIEHEHHTHPVCRRQRRPESSRTRTDFARKRPESSPNGCPWERISARRPLSVRCLCGGEGARRPRGRPGERPLPSANLEGQRREGDGTRWAQGGLGGSWRRRASPCMRRGRPRRSPRPCRICCAKLPSTVLGRAPLSAKRCRLLMLGLVPSGAMVGTDCD